MLPLSALGRDEARGLRGLFFDLDDTVLAHGKLGESAYSMVHRLAASGLDLFALTGRPLSFADFIARTWPVRGAIGENGAVGVLAEGGRVNVVDPLPEEERARRRARLAALVLRVRSACPALVPSDDCHYRWTDFTFDIGEHERADEADIRVATELGFAARARVTRSSIHLHLSFDRHDKASGAVAFLARSLGEDGTRALRTFAFVGDSDNDAPAFAAFRTSVGVANLRTTASLRPRYLTEGASAEGFVELGERLLELRSAG